MGVAGRGRQNDAAAEAALARAGSLMSWRRGKACHGICLGEIDRSEELDAGR